MHLSIDLNDWYRCLQDAMWWEELHPDHAILLYQYTQKAYYEKLKYFIQDPIGGEIELTKIYEQFKLLETLKANYK